VPTDLLSVWTWSFTTTCATEIHTSFHLGQPPTHGFGSAPPSGGLCALCRRSVCTAALLL